MCELAHERMCGDVVRARVVWRCVLRCIRSRFLDTFFLISFCSSPERKAFEAAFLESLSPEERAKYAALEAMSPAGDV
jgi:hypothetical protein